jgi:DNA polymerase III subunit epsilon
MSIVAIDFETATSDRDSACEIGLTLVDDGKITYSESWLIRPPCWPRFDYFNTRIHGITSKMVANEPTFDEIWSDIRLYFKDRTIVAHNAAFDIGVLRDMLKMYKMDIPDNPYLCTYRLARKVWPELGKYGLKTMIEHLSLEGGRHHRAAYDSHACAEVLLHAMKLKKAASVEELSRATETTLRSIQQYGHDATTTAKREIPEGNPTLYDPSHTFYGKHIVFSGTLESMSRAQAWQRVADIGARITERIDDQTNILVLGQNDANGSTKGGITSKHQHALRLIQKGQNIQLMPESEFLGKLENKHP